MTFRDISTRWEYMDFIRQARTDKPYRGTNIVKYPLGKRRYSDRYWTPRIEITDENKTNWMNTSPPIEVYYGSTMLGTYHSDNTFEFNNSHYFNGGDVMIVSSMLPGWVSFKSQYGGMMFHHRQSRVTHPVYHGMRIRLCDGAPVRDYEVHVNTVDRKLTAPLRKEYEQFFKTAGIMLRAMGDEAIYKELKEINKTPKSYGEDFARHILEMQDPAFIVMNLVLKYDWAQTTSSLNWNNHWGFKKFCMHSRGGENLLKGVKELLFKELYKLGMEEGKQYLKVKIFKPGDKLPTCNWGHKMIVDGKEVRRIA